MRVVSSLTVFALFSSALGSDLLPGSSLPPGTTTDTCGEVNASLDLPIKPVPKWGPKEKSFGWISACLCLSGIPDFIKTNGVAIAAVAYGGKAAVIDAIEDMLGKCNKEICHYPPHAVPVCRWGSPCHFDCKDGYTASPAYKPTKCVCQKPYTECNGKCGLYHGCASQKPWKRDASPATGNSLFQCQFGHTACGVLGRGARVWECIDTQHDLESCGGCIYPLPGFEAEGQDCTALSGVSDVSCVSGKCVVHRCNPGYHLNKNATCEYNEASDQSKLSAQYGLEHPL